MTLARPLRAHYIHQTTSRVRESSHGNEGEAADYLLSALQHVQKQTTRFPVKFKFLECNLEDGRTTFDILS